MSRSSSLFLKNSIVYFMDITTFIWAKYFHFKKVLFYIVYFLWLFPFLYGYLYLSLSLSVLCLKVYCPFTFIQFSSVAQSCPTLCNPWIAARQASLSITISWSSPKLMSIELVMPSTHLILCRPLLLLPPIPPSLRVFSNESTLRWGGQSTGVSALASVLPKKSEGWSPSEWNGWISLQSKGLTRVFSNTTAQKHQFFGAQLSWQSNSHIHTWPLETPYLD